MKHLHHRSLMNIMSTSLFSGLFGIALLATPAIGDNNTEPKTPQKRPGHEDIAKKQQEQAKQKKTFKPLPEKEITPAKKRSLIAKSSILVSGDQWTLIPKGSILYIPGHLKNKVATKPKGTLVDWKTFLRKNYGWIHVHQVKMAQAQGKEPIKPAAIKAYQSMGKVIVATCPGGPISVAPSSIKTK